MGGLERLLYYISKATKTIDVCVFLVTSEPLTKCIIDKLYQGIKVRLIVDGTTYESEDSQVPKFVAAGACVISNWGEIPSGDNGITSGDLLMHHKFAVIDNNIVISGSFNWTFSAAMKNNENIIITSMKEVVNPFVKEFEKLWEKFA